MDTPSSLLDEGDQEFLLDVARATIMGYVTNGKIPLFETEDPRFKEKRGAFVTLHEKRGALRGCIGYVEPIKSLLETIVEMSIACSTRDPRFDPVTADEFSNLDLEISVLTPLEEIRDVDRISVGQHGLMIKKGYFSGLLLPQVATEYRWDRRQFLRETCRKAGLDGDAWKEADAKIFIFSAQVFGRSLM
ncbi:AmmeMemoRadiSam system protein A [Candidatus Poribacteria bacterium]|nr:AmmeMemoRadiSam system protein A [Candidatus Poribacteria bacterium]